MKRLVLPSGSRQGAGEPWKFGRSWKFRACRQVKRSDMSISPPGIRHTVERRQQPPMEPLQSGSRQNSRRSILRFLSVYKTVERGVLPTQKEMASMGKIIEEGMKSGYLLAVEGCMPSA